MGILGWASKRCFWSEKDHSRADIVFSRSCWCRDEELFARIHAERISGLSINGRKFNRVRLQTFLCIYLVVPRIRTVIPFPPPSFLAFEAVIRLEEMLYIETSLTVSKSTSCTSGDAMFMSK